MEIKSFKPGDKVSLKTDDKEWTGTILESHDPEIILLKLPSGYNIGIKESRIKKAELISKSIPKTTEYKLRKKPGLKNIAIVITGGTISSKLDPKTGAVKPSKAEDILNIAPEIESICNICSISKPFLKLSEDIDSKDWKKIVKILKPMILDKNIDGIILTHGTDTIAYTSSALSFAIKNLNKPIAVTYSQKSIDRPSTDASLNLICSAIYATSDIAEIALVGHEDTNDKFCLAMPPNRTKKLHTSARYAFKIVNSSPIARISEKDIVFLRDFKKRDPKLKPSFSYEFSSKVALIKVYPGQSPDILDYLKKKKIKGIVIEATGLGHTPSKWIPRIKKLASEGIFICAVAGTIFGRLNPNVYSTGRKLKNAGLVFLEDMTSEAAFAKLSLLIGKKEKNLKEKMLEEISGEISIGFIS